MSGIKYLLDTNAIISLLSGNNHLNKKLNESDWVGVSIISQLEFLSYTKLSEKDKQLFYTFIERVEVVNLNNNDVLLTEHIISIRKNNKLKIPDAIIAASAITYNCLLITNDKAYSKVTALQAITY
ncbi:MAG: type II toxin-antitoxin system VapC family toxin [Bacteroidetes bacterium]|nr:type II toxin-antitoxin system VapC family toxin [Bacteroidota bacterium]